MCYKNYGDLANQTLVNALLIKLTLVCCKKTKTKKKKLHQPKHFQFNILVDKKIKTEVKIVASITSVTCLSNHHLTMCFYIKTHLANWKVKGCRRKDGKIHSHTHSLDTS